MAEERSLTPEKQLLKLIEEPRAQGPAHVQAQAIKYHSQSLFSFGAWLGRLSFLKDKFRDLAGSDRSYSDIVKIVNAVLAVGILSLGFYFISSLSVAFINTGKLPMLKFKAKDSSGQLAFSEAASPLKPSSFYLDKIKQRNIFRMGAKAGEDKAASAENASKIIELSQDLKLVGISWSDSPDAMIENTKAQRTFFVKKGQMIGELQVKEITRDKVIITYGGEEAELR